MSLIGTGPVLGETMMASFSFDALRNRIAGMIARHDASVELSDAEILAHRLEAAAARVAVLEKLRPTERAEHVELATLRQALYGDRAA